MSVDAASLSDFPTIDVTYAGRTVALADLPEYRKFYRKLAEGRWEADTFVALGRHVDAQTVLIDIGAWIGVTPFWSAQAAKAVIAVEPDPKCAGILKQLAKAHPKVTVIEGALSPSATVSINAVEGFGSSETSVLAIGDGESIAVPGIGLAALLERAEGAPVFVKIDIEGYEFIIADELARLSAPNVRGVQIAIHPQLYEKSLAGSRILARLRAAIATWRLGRMFAGSFAGPSLARYPSLGAYIVRGVLLRRKPKGADFLFERKSTGTRP